ncbi:hypothetical protein ACFLZH_00515 [Patescibacteria group bacterium]
MIERGQFLEDAYFDAPDKSSSAPAENVEIMKRQKIINSVKAQVEAALEEGNKMDGAAILALCAKMMKTSNQKKATGFVARKMQRNNDFGTQEIRSQYKIAERSIPTIMKLLIKTAAEFGIKIFKTTKSKGRGRYKRYYMFKSPNDPSGTPEKTNDEEIIKSPTVFDRISNNLEFIPSQYHEIVIYLALSSKHINWVTYDEITKATGLKQDTIRKYLKALEKILPKLGVKLLIKQSRINNKKFVGVALEDDDSKMNNRFNQIENQIAKRKHEKKRSPGKKKRKTTSLSLRLGPSTSDVIIKNWPKRKSRDEWYDEPIQRSDFDD